MKRSKVLILLCIGVLLAILGGYILFGAGEQEEVMPDAKEIKTETARGADLTLEDIHYVETKGKRKEWELRAKQGEYFRQGDYTILHDIDVTFFSQDGRTITMRGGRGSMKERKEINVWGGVVVSSSDGYRFATNSLRYDDVRREITTDDPVVLEGKGILTTGVGLVVDLNTKKITILRKVQTVIAG